MPAVSLRSPPVRALTISVSALSPCRTTLFAPSRVQPSPFRVAPGQHVGEVVTRLPLAMREGEQPVAFGDLRQQRGLLRIAAGEAQGGSAEHDRREIGLQRQGAAERLHHQHDLDAAAAKPAVALGKRQPEQSLLGVARPQRAAPPLRFGQVAAAFLEGVIVREQPIDAVAQQPLFVAEIEIHLYSRMEASRFETAVIRTANPQLDLYSLE